MFELEGYWKRRLAGARRPTATQLDGWEPAPSVVEGFVPPELTLLFGDPEKAKILIIAAPGAVGKSSIARQIASVTNYALVDLAKTSPLGGNFFKGGLANAFGLNALSAAAGGKIGLIVDALDEAQLRSGPQGYEAGLLDLASIANSAGALPTVLLGRALAAEDAYVSLEAAGFPACLMQIEFFDDARSLQYLIAKLPVIARRNPAALRAYETHPENFNKLASETRLRLSTVKGGGEPQFTGYAPVLDAICEFTLESEELNPQSRLANLDANSQIGLIRNICHSILEREQKKLATQFKEQNQNIPPGDEALLYTPEEQLGHIASALFGSQRPNAPSLSNAVLQTAYSDMVVQFGPQHPFLSGSAAANLVFAAYTVVWALAGAKPEIARAALRARPGLISGVLFELYVDWLTQETPRNLALADVGILYQALNSQITTGQRVALEITEEATGGIVAVQFEILERADSEGMTKQGPMWGPFLSSAEGYLELRSPFSNVFIDAPIWLELGDGIVQQIGAPTEITCSQLSILAKQLQINPPVEDIAEQKAVSLIADDADVQSVQSVIIRDADLAVSWPNAQVHPWTNYAAEVAAAPPEIDFLRRRLRKIITAFRSHSKGSLVRLAAKINHSRMTKDERGVALVQRLVRDKILSTFEAGKFYVLNPDLMANLLGVDYHGLMQQRFTHQSDAYLASVLNDMHEN